MRYWWDENICPCGDACGDITAAYVYWSEKLFALSDNPYTIDTAKEIFSCLVCEAVPQKGVAGFLIEFFTGELVCCSEKESLLVRLHQPITDGWNVEEWMLKEITPMKGDIYLILNLLVAKGVIGHSCDYGAEEGGYQGLRFWSIND